MSNESVPAGHEKPGTQLRFSTQSVRVKGVKSWARARYRRVVTGSIGIYGQSGHRWIRLPDEPCENIRVWSARHKRAVTLRLRNDATDAQRGDELSLLYARPEKGGDWQLIAVRNVTTNAVFELSQAELSSAVPDAALMPLHALGAACVGIIGAVLTGHGASEPYLWILAASCGACAWFLKSVAVNSAVRTQVAEAVYRLRRDNDAAREAGGAA
ncbi:MAG: hypothetical protein KAG72_01755 [Abyssibacter sp.]|nr:hypothetical protein [Abyssibacter sp.]MCK5858046.1 hypothetical protein [Abyssibacter sp.]